MLRSQRPKILVWVRQASQRGEGLKLLPEETFKDFETPPETLPRSPGHWVEWVNYAKGQGPVPGSNFQYAGWTTEANHLGNVAYRTGKKIEWDYKNLRATNAPEASPFIKRPVFSSTMMTLFSWTTYCTSFW